MFFLLYLPTALILFYAAAAVLPAVFFMRWIYNSDSVEPEPPELLKKLLLGGVGAVLISMVLEGILDGVFGAVYPEGNQALRAALYAFLVVAVVEEGSKYYFLRRFTWKNPAFNYRFDGIVYAAFVSLGFAALENVSYVFRFGLSVALPRACFSIPGHLAFSVAMGTFYGEAKLLNRAGHPAASRFCSVMAYVAAVCMHGFYDACAMTGTTRSSAVLLAFIVFLYFFIWKTVRWQAAHDVPV